MKSRLLMKPGKLNILLTLVIPLLLVVHAGADDWPHWRGANFDDTSTETGLLQQWPAGGPKQLWTNQESGLGYAGFSIVGDQLFTLGLENEEEFVLCLNAETGAEIWRTKIGPRYTNGWGDGPRSTPSVDGDRVYAMSAAGHLACFQIADGTQVWAVKMSDFGGEVPNWGYAESPLIDGEKVVCTPGGKVGTMLALNKLTGEKVWQSPPVMREMSSGKETGPPTAHYSSILPVDWNNQRQYIQLTVLAVIGVSADDGSILWQSTWPGRTAVIPSPLFDNGVVYVTSGYGIGSKSIQLGDNNTPKEQWYNKVMQNHHGGVVRVGDYFYGSSAKSFVCQDAKSGEQKWSERRIRKGALSYADGRVYHVEEDGGKVLLIAVDENGPVVKGSFELAPQTTRRNPRGRIWVHPVVADGKLYLRDQEIITCYDVKQ